MIEISREQATDLIGLLANPVAPEPLRSWNCSKECEIAFANGIRAFEKNDFGASRESFFESHRLLHLPEGTSSSALRNAQLALFHAGKIDDCYKEMLQWFQKKALYGPSLWNFAMIALRIGQYKIGFEALEEWRNRPVDYLIARGYLIQAAALLLIGSIEGVNEKLLKAIEKDSSYVSSRLGRIGLVYESKPENQILDVQTIDILASRLMSFLDPRKPDRYQQLDSLPIQDFKSASKAIDLVRDDHIVEAYAVLDVMSTERNAIIIKAWISAAIELQRGDIQKAEKLIDSTVRISNLPGSILWNWAFCAASRRDYKECAQRLSMCTKTEYSTKAEAWVGLMIASALAGDIMTLRHAVAKAWSLSERSKIVVAQALQGLDTKVLNLMGISLESIQLGQVPATSSLDEESLKSAWKEGNLRAAVNILATVAGQGVRELPEYESSPLEISLGTNVPREVITNNLQGEFRKGLAEVISGDVNEAINVFESLSSKFPNIRILRLNLASAYFRDNRYVEALEMAKNVFDTSSDTKRGLALKGIIACLIQEKRFAEAHKLLSEETREIGTWRYHLYQAIIAEDNKRPRELAENLFELARIIPNPSFELLGLTAVRCVEVKDWNRAKEVIEAAISRSQVSEAIAGSTFAGVSVKQCRYYKEMNTAFSRLEKSRDWVAATDFFAAVERNQETNFYGSKEKHALVPMLNAKIFLGRSLLKQGKSRAAEESLRSALQLMERSRDRMDPNIEAGIALHVAKGYEELQAPFRQLDALRIADRATPNQAAILKALRLCKLPSINEPVIAQAINEMASEMDKLYTTIAEPQLDNTLASVIKLATLINDSEMKRVAEMLFGFLKKILIYNQPETPANIRSAVNALDELILSFTLHLAAESLEVATEILSRFEEWIQMAVEEATKPIFSVIPIESHHDGINANLLIECRSRTNRELGPIFIRLNKVRELQPIGTPLVSLNIEKLLPGQKYQASSRFGITGTWPARMKVKIPISIEIGEKENRTLSIKQDLTCEFELFEEANIIYPGGAIGPEDVNGRPLYGRQELVSRLASSLGTSRQSRLFFLFGPRKVGKTSILKFVIEEIQTHFPKYICAIVNFDRDWPEGSPVARITNDIARAVKKNPNLNITSLPQPYPKTMEDLVDWLEELRSKLGVEHFVLMLDEFGKLIEYLSPLDHGASFLGDLRHLWSNIKELSLLVADWHSGEELANSVPAQFWADLAVEPVGFLDETASRAAIRGPAEGTQVQISDDANKRIFQLTQGYPWHLQELCDLSVREAARNLRHCVISEDVDQAAERLISDPRTFKEGLFRPERIAGIEEVILWKICRYADNPFKGIPISIISGSEPSITLDVVLTRLQVLASHSIVRIDGDQVRLCTPLMEMWLKNQFNSAKRIAEEALPVDIELSRLRGVILDHDILIQLQKLTEGIFDTKKKLGDSCTLHGIPKPFNDIDYSEEKKRLLTQVDSLERWDPFIGGLKRAFVDDVAGSLKDLQGGPLETLRIILDELRLRRNFVEHPQTPTKKAREVELAHRQADIEADEPKTIEDWTKMQVGLLQRLFRAFELQVAELTLQP